MNKIGKLALVAGILAMALAVPMTAAHVIYLYQAQVSMPSALPVYFQPGPDASEVGLTLSNKSPQIELTVPVTNATEIYVYQALIVNVSSTPTSPLSGYTTLYVEYCTYSGSPSFNNITLIVYPVTGYTGKPVPTGSAQEIVIKPSTTGCSASGSITLNPSIATSYYIDFAIYPAQPIYKGPVNSAVPGTLQIVFGFSYGSGTPSQGFVPYPYP